MRSLDLNNVTANDVTITLTETTDLSTDTTRSPANNNQI